jgi:hypothetical protein
LNADTDARTKSDQDRIKYRSACHVTNRLINRSRRKYINKRLTETGGNTGKRWRIAQELLHNKDRDYGLDKIESQKLCRMLSDFFVNKLNTIRHTIQDRLALLNPNISTSHASSPPPLLNQFRQVTLSETLQLIKNCPMKTSPLDFIPTSLLKDCCEVFAPLVCKLANLSFTEGIFPDIFKTGQITPLMKKPGANSSDLANYRPITNLNTISKILERLANTQLVEHLPM